MQDRRPDRSPAGPGGLCPMGLPSSGSLDRVGPQEKTAVRTVSDRTVGNTVHHTRTEYDDDHERETHTLHLQTRRDQGCSSVSLFEVTPAQAQRWLLVMTSSRPPWKWENIRPAERRAVKTKNLRKYTLNEHTMPYIKAPDGDYVVYVDQLPEGYKETPIKPKSSGRRGKPLRNQCVEVPGYAEKVAKAMQAAKAPGSEFPEVFGRVHTCPHMLAIMAEAAKASQQIVKKKPDKAKPTIKKRKEILGYTMKFEETTTLLNFLVELVSRELRRKTMKANNFNLLHV
ncbi:hypothetical protein EDC01DRAFT_752632 [Geopyxis carbonaria]|nr:hypothetical protein EDC01DRAFT_752632 [Geopyxis carbonaria]